MATYLPNVTDSVPMPLLYQPNIQFLIQSGMYAAQRYQAVLNKMNEVYGQYAEKPILNPEVDKRRDNYIKEMQVYIDKFKNVNLLEPEVITTFTDIFKPIAKDPLIYYHMKNTEDYINERSANELLRFSPLGEVKDGKGDDYVIYDENITKSLDTMAEYMKNLQLDNPDNYRELIPKGLVSIDVDRFIWDNYKDKYKESGRSEVYFIDGATGKMYLYGSDEYVKAVNNGEINKPVFINVNQPGTVSPTGGVVFQDNKGWILGKEQVGNPNDKGLDNFAAKTIIKDQLNGKDYEIVNANLFYLSGEPGKNKLNYYKFNNLQAGVAAGYNYINKKFERIMNNGGKDTVFNKDIKDLTYYDLLRSYIGYPKEEELRKEFQPLYDSALERSLYSNEIDKNNPANTKANIETLKNKKIVDMLPGEILNRILKQESGLTNVILLPSNFNSEYAFFRKDKNGNIQYNAQNLNINENDIKKYITDAVLEEWNKKHNITKITNNPSNVIAEKGAYIFSTDGSIIKQDSTDKEVRKNDHLITLKNNDAILSSVTHEEYQPAGVTSTGSGTTGQQVEARLGYSLFAINRRGGEEQVYSAYELTNEIMKNNPAIQSHFKTQALTKYINMWGAFGFDSGKAMDYIMNDIDKSTKELDDKISYYGNLSYMSDMAKANIEKELKSMIADKDIYLARVSDILNATEQIKNFDNISKQTKQIANEVQKTKDAADKVKNVKVSDSSFLDVVKTLANIKGSILSHLNAFDNGKAIAMNMYKETAQTLASNVGALKPGGTGYGGSGSGGGVGDAKNIPYGPSMNGEIIIGYDNNNKAQVVPNDFSVSVGLNTYHIEGHNMRNMEKDLLNNVKETLGGAGYTIELLNFNDKEHNYVSQMLKDRNTDPSTQTNVNSVGAYLYKVHITDNNNVKEETRVVTYKNQNGTMSPLSIYRVVKKPDNSNTTQQ